MNRLTKRLQRVVGSTRTAELIGSFQSIVTLLHRLGLLTQLCRTLRESHPLILQNSSFDVGPLVITEKSLILGIRLSDEVETAAITFHDQLRHDRFFDHRFQLKLRCLERNRTQGIHLILTHLSHQNKLPGWYSLYLARHGHIRLGVNLKSTTRQSEQCH